MENSNRMKILAAGVAGLLLIIAACLFGASAKTSWGTATDVIPAAELSEEELAALGEALELNLFEGEEIANLTRLVHPGEEPFIEYRVSIITTGEIAFFARNGFIKKHFTEYSPATDLIINVKRGYYFRDKKIYISAVYSKKLAFTAAADAIFRARENETLQSTTEAAE